MLHVQDRMLVHSAVSIARGVICADNLALVWLDMLVNYARVVR